MMAVELSQTQFRQFRERVSKIIVRNHPGLKEVLETGCMGKFAVGMYAAHFIGQETRSSEDFNKIMDEFDALLKSTSEESVMEEYIDHFTGILENLDRSIVLINTVKKLRNQLDNAKELKNLLKLNHLTENDLEFPCDDELFQTLNADFKTVASKFGLSQDEVNNTTTAEEEKEKVISMYRKWKEDNGSRATCCELVMIFLTCKQIHAASSVVSFAQAKKPSPIIPTKKSPKTSRQHETSQKFTTVSMLLFISVAVNVVLLAVFLLAPSLFERPSYEFETDKLPNEASNGEVMNKVDEEQRLLDLRTKNDAIIVKFADVLSSLFMNFSEHYEKTIGHTPTTSVFFGMKLYFSALDRKSEVTMNDMNDVFTFIGERSNWLNCRLLELFVTRYGGESENITIQGYINQLTSYLNQSLQNIPLERIDICEPADPKKKVVLRYYHITDCNYTDANELLQIRERIAKLLNITVGLLVICKVKCSSIKIEFHCDRSVFEQSETAQMNVKQVSEAVYDIDTFSKDYVIEYLRYVLALSVSILTIIASSMGCHSVSLSDENKFFLIIITMNIAKVQKSYRCLRTNTIIAFIMAFMISLTWLANLAFEEWSHLFLVLLLATTLSVITFWDVVDKFSEVLWIINQNYCLDFEYCPVY